MTLWLTLLLVWTTGIPAALFLAATIVAALGQRRSARFRPLAMPRRLSLLSPGCGRRTHSFRRLSLSGERPIRAHAGSRRFS